MKNFLTHAIILIMLFSISLLIFTTPVLADDYGLEDTANAAGLSNTEVDIPARIGQIVGIALSFIGILFLGLTIYGGIIWMLARGNEQEITRAKGIVQAAIVGLIIVVASYAITSFVLNQLLS